MIGYLNEQAVVAVRAAMDRAGVNQTELARRCGVSVPAVSRSLSGRQNLTLGIVERYLDALGTTAQVVVDRTPASSDAAAAGEVFS